MTQGERVSLVLEVRRSRVPRGQLCGPHGRPEPFDGWLQLLAALERSFELLDAPPAAAPDDPCGSASPR